MLHDIACFFFISKIWLQIKSFPQGTVDDPERLWRVAEELRCSATNSEFRMARGWSRTSQEEVSSVRLAQRDV